MCITRTSALVIEGPVTLPEGSRDATERHAARRGLDLRWQRSDTVAAIAELLQAATVSGDQVVLASGSLASARQLATAIATTRSAGTTVVHVDTEELDHLDVVHHASDRAIHGRGRRSLRGALDWIGAEREHPSTTIAYGEHPAQVGDLRLPLSGPGPAPPAPIAVLLHGGFWLDPWERDQMARLAVALGREGWASWNVEYRRLGPSGGGWPMTLEDACAAVDAVADLAVDHAIDPARTVVVGHSAGAQLGAYVVAHGSTGRERQRSATPVAPIGLVSLAGVLDLYAAAVEDLGDGAVRSLFGEPAAHPERYRLASPIELRPLNIPVLAIHGHDDRMVPEAQTLRFVAAARAAGDSVEHASVDAPHLDIVDPDGAAMEGIARWLPTVAT